MFYPGRGTYLGGGEMGNEEMEGGGEKRMGRGSEEGTSESVFDTVYRVII